MGLQIKMTNKPRTQHHTWDNDSSGDDLDLQGKPGVWSVDKFHGIRAAGDQLTTSRFSTRILGRGVISSVQRPDLVLTIAHNRSGYESTSTFAEPTKKTDLSGCGKQTLQTPPTNRLNDTLLLQLLLKGDRRAVAPVGMLIDEPLLDRVVERPVVQRALDKAAVVEVGMLDLLQ